MDREKFHGRVKGADRPCSHPGCPLTGEFRAPGQQLSGFDGPASYRWFCLEHVREFNARYDWFDGMSQDEIEAAQMPAAGWERQTRAFSATAGVDSPPRWADFKDPLEAISGRFRSHLPKERADGRPLSAEDRTALKSLGLPHDASLHDVRSKYSVLVRKYHPDRNGGDRSHEKKLQEVIEAYQRLRKAPAFAA